MSYYFFCHVTDEQPLNTCPSMRGENDQIDALIFCRVENLFRRIAACDKVSDLWQVPRPMDNLLTRACTGGCADSSSASSSTIPSAHANPATRVLEIPMTQFKPASGRALRRHHPSWAGWRPIRPQSYQAQCGWR